MNLELPQSDTDRATRRQVVAVLAILGAHLGKEIQRERAESNSQVVITALQSVRIAVLDTVTSTMILNLSSTEPHVPTTH